MSSGAGCRQGSDPVWLGVWSAAVALIGPLDWEPAYAAGMALKTKKNKKKTTLPTLYKWHKVPTHLFRTWLAEYFKPTIENFFSGKKDSFQNITVH